MFQESRFQIDFNFFPFGKREDQLNRVRVIFNVSICLVNYNVIIY